MHRTEIRLMQSEFFILDLIQNLRSPILDWIMIIFTYLGDSGIFWIALNILLLIYPKTRKLGICMLIALGIEIVCCNLVLKPLIARIRPFEINTAIKLLVSPPHDFSFPSGHTGLAFAAVSVMFFREERIWIPFGIIAILISFSRLYLYVHYPTDVLAGMLLGLMSGWIAVKISRAYPQLSENK